MKNKIKSVLFVSFFVLLVSTSFSQNMDSFFKHEAVKTLANLAHPTNNYKGGEYNVYTNYVLINIFYKNYTTKLKVYRKGNYFNKIITISDNDFIPPFSGIEIIKNFLIEGTENTEERRKLMNIFEKRFDKAILDMTGKEIACIILTINWFNY